MPLASSVACLQTRHSTAFFINRTDASDATKVYSSYVKIIKE
jgi:hypothetical protein